MHLQLQLVNAAIAAGELRKDTDPESLLDAVLEPLYLRFQIGHAPLDKKFATSLVEQVLKAVTA